ncbi:POT family proton-dependent oligopeptide transporter [Elusimicrobium simillimum]|uniref:peptide MFS transporter n=1 Tax=Elusimicrobium simillimum TaxID=3143438 RepID=UPI003C705EF1
MQSSQTIQEKQPAGLYLLAATEMWERFSYYAMRGLFVLYLVNALGFAQDKASNLYGSFTSLIYLAPLAGGFIADKYWGQRKAIIVGALFIIAGQVVMGIKGISFAYVAMGLLIIGNGLFKPNISTIVGELYEKNDPRRDGGFTIFYMGINLGAFICNLIAGTLAEKVDWHWGFWTAALGMVFGLGLFLWGKDKYLQGKGLPPAQNKAIAAEKKEEKKEAGSEKLTKQEWQRIAVIFILAFFSIFFWSAFEQAGAALNLFAYQHTDRVISFLNWEVPATWFQSLNPMFIILFAPVFSKMWVGLAKKGKEPSTPIKFVIALWLLAIGFGVMVLGAMALGPGIKIGMYYLALAYMFHTLGELCLSPVGLSMVTKLAPAKFVSLLMGVWFLANATANKLAGTYSSLFGKIDNVQFFLWLVIAPMVASFVLLALVKPLKKWMHGIK